MKKLPVIMALALLVFTNIARTAPESGIKVKMSVEGEVSIGNDIKLLCSVSSSSEMKNVVLHLLPDDGIDIIKKNDILPFNLTKDEIHVKEFVIRPNKSGLLKIETIVNSVLDSLSSLSGNDVLYLELPDGREGEAKRLSQMVFNATSGCPSEPVAKDDIKIILDKKSGKLAGPHISNDITDDDSIKNGHKGYITIIGRYLYHHSWDQAGVWRPVVNATVEAWDDDVSSGDDLLGTSITHWDGSFSIGPVSNDDGWLQGTQDVYVKIWLHNNTWKVVNINNEKYWWHTNTINNVPDGLVNFGDQALGSAYVGAVATFDAMNHGWNFATINGHNPGYIVGVWPCGSSSWSNNSYICIGDAHCYSSDIVQHEYAHAMMYNAYGGWWPPNATGEHQINLNSNINLAWTEGFADFYPLAVTNDKYFNWDNPAYSWGFNLEYPYGDEGDACEARVAGALLDIFDDNDNYELNDYTAYGFDEIWNIVWNYNNSSFYEFWNSWKSAGYEKHFTVQSIYLNTIDYDFAPSLSGLPDFTLFAGSSGQAIFDLDDYAHDEESSDNRLYFSITNNTNPICNYNIDSYHRVDIIPESGLYGYTDVTFKVTDGIKYAQDVCRITISPDPLVLPRVTNLISNVIPLSSKGEPIPCYVSLTWMGATGSYPLSHYIIERKYPYSSQTSSWTQLSTTTATNVQYYYSNIPTDLAYRITPVDSRGYVGYSQVTIINSPPPGDPLVAVSQSNEATAYSNGRKIIMDKVGNLHVTYTSGDTIFYTKSVNEGETWTPSRFIDYGTNPAIALRSSNNKSGIELPSICYVSGNALLIAEKYGDEQWSQPQSVYQGMPGEVITYLSFELDGNDNQYAGWVSSSSSGSMVNIAQGSPGGGQLAPSPIDQGGQTSFKSPSLSLDKNGNLLVAWSHDGKVRYYKSGDSEIIDLSQPGKYCIHPIVESFGDRVSVIWQELDDNKGLEPGRYKIISRTINEYGWSEEKIIAYSTIGDYQYPVAVAASQYLYAGQQENGDYDIHYAGEYKNGYETYRRNISYFSGGHSGYPCALLSRKWPEHSLFILWTESFPDNSKAIAGSLVKVYKEILAQPVPIVGVYPNTHQTSSYCIQRSGGLCYGSGVYMTVDYHPNELKYRIDGLNKDNRYKIKSVFYRSTNSGNGNPSSNWLLMPKCDQVSFGTIHLPDTTIVVMEREIPKQCFADGTVDVSIKKIRGDYAICSAIEIFEYTSDEVSKSGGVQALISGPIFVSYRYELLQNAPNPCRQGTTIRYQLAKPGKVSLKVYNTLGQVVKTIVDSDQQPGLYSINWDGKDNQGRQVANGVYLYRLSAGSFTDTKKLVKIK